MNKKMLYAVILSAFFIGCKKDFLTQPPLDQLTDQTYWRTEDNVRTFAYGFYAPYFVGYGSSYSGGVFFSRQTLNDDFAPAAPDPFPVNVPTSGGGWNFDMVRKENIFIDRVQRVQMSQEAIAHWTGVGRFFRGMEYASLVNKFGDVPYYNHALTEDDTAALYKPRDPRILVMDSVLADFQYAAANVRVTDNSTGPKGLVVNRDVVLAFMSRIFLFEGTWQKYHNGNQAKATEYLTAAKWASNEIITGGNYSLGKNFRDLFSSEDLSGNPEMIMYRAYASAMLTHTIMSYNNKSAQPGASKNLIDSYLSSDGLPISLSPEYKGDTDFTQVLHNRDRRINETFDSAIHLQGIVANYSTTGYSSHLFLNDALKDELEGSLDQNVTDAPIIRLGEVLLNYAEATAELGQLTQEDLDISINKLRARADIKMPPLQVIGDMPAVNGVVYDDPLRDPSVPALIWEIRRERRVELVFQGFRLDDLRRWGKLSYSDTEGNSSINEGAWINKADYPKAIVEIEGGANEGYIIPSPNAKRIFNDPKLYLSPIPLDQITLYSDQGVTLKQNPGWE